MSHYFIFILIPEVCRSLSVILSRVQRCSIKESNMLYMGKFDQIICHSVVCDGGSGAGTGVGLSDS